LLLLLHVNLNLAWIELPSEKHLLIFCICVLSCRMNSFRVLSSIFRNFLQYVDRPHALIPNLIYDSASAWYVRLWLKGSSIVRKLKYGLSTYNSQQRHAEKSALPQDSVEKRAPTYHIVGTLHFLGQKHQLRASWFLTMPQIMGQSSPKLLFFLSFASDPS